MIEISMDAEYKLKRIAENLFLDQKERDKLFILYDNSSPEIRDIIVSELEAESKSKEFEVRYELKQRIRKS